MRKKDKAVCNYQYYFKEILEYYCQCGSLENAMALVYQKCNEEAVIEDKMLEWFTEEHVHILDDEEKEYLRKVIAPFRRKVKYIYKGTYATDSEREFIRIVVIDKLASDFEDTCVLPDFKAGTMYKGMEINRDYKIGELDLWIT